MRFILLAILLPSLVFAQKKNTSLEQKIKEFDQYVETGRVKWEVPGMAVAVVKDGKVIFSKGYGTKEIGQNNPVDTQTLFSIGSTTKAMTAVCMGMLVDEGKISWDEPVIKYLPEYQLYDPYVTRELRIRDLFLHNSGVGNADFVWTIMDIPVAEIFKKMKDVKPSYSFRSGFIYQNIFYIAAGEVIKRVSGMPWESFIQQRIFTPLAMTRTAPMRRFIKDDNQTKPHNRVEGKIVTVPYTKDDEVNSAGSVWSSIDDMSKWVLCMLDSSKYPGGRLLKKNTWAEMFKPQTIVTDSEFYPTQQLTKPHWKTYGLGWFQQDYQGRKLNFHTGSLNGLTAITGQIQEERVGVMVMGNLDHAEIRHAILYKSMDHFALGGTRDWSTEFYTLYGNRTAMMDKMLKDFEGKRVANTKPTLPLQAYAGKYSDPLYGDVEVTLQGNQLVLVANHIVKLTAEHWNYDTFRGWFEDKSWGKANATFILGPTGQVDKVSLDGMEFARKN